MTFVRKKGNIIARRIHGGYFLIDICDNYAGDRCALHEINETGMFLWEHIGENTAVPSLARQLHAAIADDVEYSMILSDVQEYIEALKAEGFVEVSEIG